MDNEIVARLEAAPMGALAMVQVRGGELLPIERVPGGWYLDGDVVVASADVAEGAEEVWLICGDDPFDERDYQ